MNRILFFISLTLCFIVSNAQTDSRQSEIDALANKVDSLEHVVSYMNLSSELYSLINEMSILKNDIQNSYIEIKLDIFNKNFDRRLGNVRNQLYDAVEYRKKSLLNKIEIVKAYYTLRIINYPYSEVELRILNAAYDAISTGLESLETTIESLKTAIDIYNELM